jgi:hypothetical protein
MRLRTPDRGRCLRWLESVVNGDAAYAVSDFVLSGFSRIVTHPHVFDPPSTLSAALKFVSEVRNQPQSVLLSPGPRHWAILTELSRAAGAKGNLVPDASLAAIAIESGCEWVTIDRDYSRFPKLRWRHP